MGCGVEQRQRRWLLQMIDTSLLKCYQVTNVARIAPLLRQENYCLLEEAEQILKANNCIKVRFNEIGGEWIHLPIDRRWMVMPSRSLSHCTGCAVCTVRRSVVSHQ